MSPEAGFTSSVWTVKLAFDAVSDECDCPGLLSLGDSSALSALNTSGMDGVERFQAASGLIGDLFAFRRRLF